LPIIILRHIHKKRYSVFLSRFLRICNQSVQKVTAPVFKLLNLEKYTFTKGSQRGV
jgi:hypothetical protein